MRFFYQLASAFEGKPALRVPPRPPRLTRCYSRQLRHDFQFPVETTDDFCNDEWDEDRWHNVVSPPQIRIRPGGTHCFPSTLFIFAVLPIQQPLVIARCLLQKWAAERTPEDRKRSSRKNKTDDHLLPIRTLFSVYIPVRNGDKLLHNSDEAFMLTRLKLFKIKRKKPWFTFVVQWSSVYWNTAEKIK